MKNEKEDIICNRFVQVLGEWVAIHDEEIHFQGRDLTKPQIKLCGSSLRVRANDAWTKLPEHLREATVAHEIGHRAMDHASVPQNNPFYRMGFVIMHNTVDPRELEADRYACKIISKKKYIAALKELMIMEKQNKDPNVLTIREFGYRIEELERNSMN
jgi:hypothetical protein